MKVGDLVILEYKGVDLEEKDRKKIGIVVRGDVDLAKVLWSSGDQTWCMQQQLEVVNESR
tara:strand:+ start:1558 stop:1737 length:180 start_codon:yes stop_codon:yes gene_type:complete